MVLRRYIGLWGARLQWMVALLRAVRRPTLPHVGGSV